jgi:hypothetical protein
MKVSDILKKLKQDQHDQMRNKLEMVTLKEHKVERTKQDQEKQRSDKKQTLV